MACPPPACGSRGRQHRFADPLISSCQLPEHLAADAPLVRLLPLGHKLLEQLSVLFRYRLDLRRENLRALAERDVLLRKIGERLLLCPEVAYLPVLPLLLLGQRLPADRGRGGVYALERAESGGSAELLEALFLLGGANLGESDGRALHQIAEFALGFACFPEPQFLFE